MRYPHDCTTLLLCCCREGCRCQSVAVKCAPRSDAAPVAEQQARFKRQAAASAATAAIAIIRAAAAAICPTGGGCGTVYCCPHPAMQQQRAINQRRPADAQECTLLWSCQQWVSLHHPVPAMQLQACPFAPAPAGTNERVIQSGGC